MFENIGTVAASVAWELIAIPEPARLLQLARLKKEHPFFHALVVEHLQTLRY